MTKEPALREIILDILMEVLEKNQYTHLVLNQALAKYRYLDKPDRSFMKRVTDGTVEYRLQIDFVLNQYSNTKVNRMKPVIRTILRMAVYQILYMDRVPDSAACNEAVKLAKKRGFAGLKGFVNGVLRKIVREKETLVFPDDSVRYSMPQWLVDLWTEQYGSEVCRRMMAAFLEKQKLMVRVNMNLAEPETVISSLEEQEVQVTRIPGDPGMLILDHVDYPESLQSFRDGLIQIQDLSSSMAGDAAGIQKGDFVLDVCGAPGGKALHAADLLAGTGEVLVRDLTEGKVSLIEDNIRRSGFTNIRAEVFDAREEDVTLAGKADVVIADLPCSGLGIIGRKPDIKYNVTPEKISALAELQREILAAVQSCVKPGGTLVYSTCTVNRQENEENREWFLSHYPFEPVDIEDRLAKEFRADSLKQGMIQLLPGTHPCDGFFIAVMRRKRETL